MPHISNLYSPRKSSNDAKTTRDRVDLFDVSVLGARSEDPATRQEIDQVKQRIEELEKKQEEDKREFGKLSDLAKYVSIGGVLSGAFQYEWVSGPSDPGDLGRGAVSFQPEVRVTPTENDEIFFLFGFAAGNGLPGVTPFILAPWAAGLEDDVKDINGRNRDYLLQAWHKHTFEFSEDNKLGMTGGIIDSTNYLDDNAYASDEYAQFMNEAFVNASNGFLPSWDIGGALEWDYGRYGVTGVYMNVGENDDGNKSLYSGGINISGGWWGSEQDTIGIGFGCLDGPEQTEESINYTRVAEGYVRFGLNDYLSLTFDLQYMKDKYVDTASDNAVDGWIAGVRMTAEF